MQDIWRGSSITNREKDLRIHYEQQIACFWTRTQFSPNIGKKRDKFRLAQTLINVSRYTTKF